MATPVIAGLLTLIRQFFIQGWYKSIKKIRKNSCESINPTPSLLRAMLINSVEPIDGIVPNVIFCFWIPKHVIVLPIKGNIGLRVLKKETNSSKEHHVYKFHIERNWRLSVTMSYIEFSTDYINMHPIFCDIYHVVKAPNSKLYYDNQYKNKQTEHFSTNERVILDGKDFVAGEWEIHILSNEYTIDVSPIYSIVIQLFLQHHLIIMI